MSDAALRAALRDAGGRDEGPRWLRLAQAFAREGRGAEAAHALARARSRGAPRAEVEAQQDALAPDLAALTLVRELDGGHGPLTDAVFSPCGRFVHALAERRAVVAFDLDSGTCRRVASLTGRVSALGPSLDGRSLLLALRTVLVPVDASTGRLGSPLGHDHVGRILDGALVGDDAIFRDRIFEQTFLTAHRPSGEVALRFTAPLVALDRSGAFVSVEGERLALHDPLGSAPRATVDLSDPSRGLKWVSSVAACGTRAVLFPGEQFPGAAVPEVVLFDHDGRELVATPAPEWLHATTPVASPSGRHVAGTHAAILPGHGADPTAPRTELTLLDVATGRTFEPAHGPELGDPVWSPDGRRLACPSSSGVLLVVEGA